MASGADPWSARDALVSLLCGRSKPLHSRRGRPRGPAADVGVRPTTFAVALRNTGGLGLRRAGARRGTLRACATIHLMRIAVLILGTMAAALAQDKPGAVIRIDVNLVQVDAVVTDSHVKHVTDLKASDCEILQDGKPQTITNFSYHSSPVVRRANTTPARGAGPVQDTIDPAAVRRTVVIVIDNLGMAFENLVRSRNAVRK